MSESGKKWRLAKYGLAVGTVVSTAGLVGWLCNVDGAAGVLAQGLGLISLVYGTYSAANVKQKEYIGAHYVAALDDRNGGKDE